MRWAVLTLLFAGTAAARPIDRILDSGDYQRELPGATAPKSESDLPEVDWDPAPSGVTVRAPPAPSAAVGAAVGWIALALLVGLLLVWAVSAWRSRRRAPAEPAAHAPAPAAVSAVVGPGSDDEPGDPATRIHRLLLRALERLGHREALPHAATAWEIVRRTRDPALREPLAGLVRGVEAVRWALTPVGAAELAECEAHYRALTARLQAIGPAGEAR